MLNKIKNLSPTRKAWDRTPRDYTGHVSTGVEHALIPAPLRTKIERSGVKVEFYSDPTAITPVGILMLWSPKNGGTIHIESSFFKKLRFLDRMVIINLSLNVHDHIRKGDLTVTRDCILWQNREIDGSFDECIDLYRTGMVQSASVRLGGLPWFVNVRPSKAATETQDCHAGVFEKLIGESYAW